MTKSSYIELRMKYMLYLHVRGPPPKKAFLGKLVILGQVGNGQNLTLELISVHQTIKGDPNNGLDELEPN